MSSFETPAEIAAERFEADEAPVAWVIETFLEILDDPDRDMIEAGAAELEGICPDRLRRRVLAERVWRAMLARAQ